MLFRAVLISLLYIVSIQPGFAGPGFANNKGPENFDLSINESIAITISQFGVDGDRILWIPSEFGIRREEHYRLLDSLASLGHQVWLAEIHESYFIPSGRKSYTGIPVSDISDLIEKSLPEADRRLFIVSTGRGAALALMALNHWQATSSNSQKFGGIIMIHPNLQANTPRPGTDMQYLPIVDSTQIPVFIIQPKKSEKYWFLDKLVTRLSDSGSQVYTQIIEQASDGYHVRPDTSNTEKELANKLPMQISRAVKLLAKTEVVAQHQATPATAWQLTAIPESLQPYPGETVAPPLELYDTDGKKYGLKDSLGTVVVINFWATWCPPCVDEIPSLGRLQNIFPKDDLLVVSVDIGENKDDVAEFLKEVPADFPVLLDPEADTLQRWKVTAFPTTLVINRQGVIELAYYGGLEWDSPGVVKQLQTLVERQDGGRGEH
jgi:thiol-disulfide isomerase/thioredoxin